VIYGRGDYQSAPRLHHERGEMRTKNVNKKMKAGQIAYKNGNFN
jgi:hypothetical protein